MASYAGAASWGRVPRVWFYSSHKDVFVPIDTMLNLSYETLETKLSSAMGVLELLREIVLAFYFREGVKAFRINWAYVDRSSEGCLVLRFFFEFSSERGYAAGDAFVIAIGSPSELSAGIVSYLGSIVRKHRLIDVIPSRILDQLRIELSGGYELDRR